LSRSGLFGIAKLTAIRRASNEQQLLSRGEIVLCHRMILPVLEA
jgi:hypothetical protein